ncbi:tripartite tricarboxylate transporter TctB family protein [Salipiger sp.]|uniref:tripartite tricarboxylate transporter TctB family protein n=1 Tax=Salipiger sp. TaxID=2078585 RepID=UPI003A981DC8
MTKTVRDLIAGAVLLALAIGTFGVSIGITSKMKMGVDSGYFPERAAVLLGALAIILLVRTVLRRRSDAAEDVEESGDTLNVLVVFASFIVYAVALPLAGFILATLVFFVVLLALLAPADGRNWLAFAAVSAVMTLAIHTAFTRGFGVVLPSGPF